MEWSKPLKIKNDQQRKSYQYWHMPAKKRREAGWNDKDELAMRIEFGDGHHHEQLVALTSGGSFHLSKDAAGRVEQVAKSGIHSEVRFIASLATSINLFQEELEKEIEKSFKRSHEERLARLRRADKLPAVSRAFVTIRKRNADVVVEVLCRANGKCEVCGNAAPFQHDDERPYLEVHHKIWLANSGEDTVENAVALFPNCHREAHFGQQVKWRRELSKVKYW